MTPTILPPSRDCCDRLLIANQRLLDRGDDLRRKLADSSAGRADLARRQASITSQLRRSEEARAMLADDAASWQRKAGVLGDHVAAARAVADEMRVRRSDMQAEIDRLHSELADERESTQKWKARFNRIENQMLGMVNR